jgi:hypothetical protein
MTRVTPVSLLWSIVGISDDCLVSRIVLTVASFRTRGSSTHSALEERMNSPQFKKSRRRWF